MRARITAIATVVTCVVVTQVAASACPTIGYAALQATGSKHGSREYVAYVDGLTSKEKTLTFEITIENEAKPMLVEAAASRAMLFVVPRADASSVRIAGLCGASQPFAIQPTKLTREFFFDDDAAWIKKGEITALPFSAPSMTSILLTDFTAKARRRNLQGVTRVVAAIGPDGVVQDSEVLESSGSVELDDLAMEAALHLRFTPARLHADAGGAAIGSVDDITVTFTPGMTSANAH